MAVGEQLTGALEPMALGLREPAVTFVVPGLNEAESLPLPRETLPVRDSIGDRDPE